MSIFMNYEDFINCSFQGVLPIYFYNVKMLLVSNPFHQHNFLNP